MTHSSVEVIRLDLPATYTSLSILRACLAELLNTIEGDEDRSQLTYGIQLAAHETCANIIDHAYGGDATQRIAVTLMLDRVERRLDVELHDTGIAFNREQALDPDLDTPQVHGYGLFLIRTIMDDVSYQAKSCGNKWRLVKHF